MRDDADGDVSILLRFSGPRPAVPPDRRARVRKAVHAGWRAAVRARRCRRALLWFAMPALAAAALVVTFGPERWRSEAPADAPAAIARVQRVTGPLRASAGTGLTAGSLLEPGVEIATSRDARAALRLASGPSLRLDAGTTLRLVSDTILDLARGGLYVDSGGAGWPHALRVRTPAGVVRDIGTRFEVRVRDDAVQLSVRDGLASLQREGAAHEALAGTRLTVDAGGGVTREGVPPYGSDWSWIEEIAPPFEIEGRTLTEFLAWVERETGRRVRFADEVAARERRSTVLHGSIAGLRPEAAAEAVLPTCGLVSHLDGDTLVILRSEAAAGYR